MGKPLSKTGISGAIGGHKGEKPGSVTNVGKPLRAPTLFIRDSSLGTAGEEGRKVVNDLADLH